METPLGLEEICLTELPDRSGMEWKVRRDSSDPYLTTQTLNPLLYRSHKKSGLSHKTVYPYFNPKTIQSSGKLSAQP